MIDGYQSRVGEWTVSGQIEKIQRRAQEALRGDD